jgi:hypothetical protein
VGLFFFGRSWGVRGMRWNAIWIGRSMENALGYVLSVSMVYSS